MVESYHYRDMLVPELESEFDRTRHTLEMLPDGRGEFRPHEKSSPLAKLAGHVAELPSFMNVMLTAPDVDLRSPSNPRKPVVMETKQQLLAEFNELVDKFITTIKHTADEVFHQHWSLAAGDHRIFSGSRYEALRALGIAHMIHHRAQLGVYLRLMNHTVPSTYGPSADELKPGVKMPPPQTA